MAMGIRFNADEVFVIAERIETNGAAFYGAAAAKVSSPGSRLLHDLAAWEEKHREFFAGLRKSLTDADREQIAADPDGEAALYLQSLADGVIFDPAADPLCGLGPEPTLQQILRAALAREKDAIAFFTGMQRLVPVSFGKSRIEEIIKEEMNHVTIIAKELAALARA
jgi:rubrerythrin